MKPINQKERKKAILKVTLMFLFAWLIAIILGFSTMKVPGLSEAKSGKKLANLEKIRKYQEEVFAPGVIMADSLLDGMKSGGDVALLDSELGNLTFETSNKIPETEAWEVKMYNDVLSLISSYKLTLKDQQKLDAQSEGMQDLRDKLKDCQDQNKSLSEQVKDLKAGGGGGGADCSAIERELSRTKTALSLTRDTLRQKEELIRTLVK